jgi:O-antigen biosynthesis protein WbqP
MPKLRTMKESTPELASDVLENINEKMLPYGFFFRKFSIDELPQLYSILLGHMTLVGPRPALHNQLNLIKLRNKYYNNSLKPGITGWAQINGRDNISDLRKVRLEFCYYKKRSLLFDFFIIIKTFKYVFLGKNVRH